MARRHRPWARPAPAWLGCGWMRVRSPERSVSGFIEVFRCAAHRSRCAYRFRHHMRPTETRNSAQYSHTASLSPHDAIPHRRLGSAQVAPCTRSRVPSAPVSARARRAL